MAWVRTDDVATGVTHSAHQADASLPLSIAVPVIAALSLGLWFGIVRLIGVLL